MAGAEPLHTGRVPQSSRWRVCGEGVLGETLPALALEEGRRLAEGPPTHQVMQSFRRRRWRAIQARALQQQPVLWQDRPRPPCSRQFGDPGSHPSPPLAPHAHPGLGEPEDAGSQLTCPSGPASHSWVSPGPRAVSSSSPWPEARSGASGQRTGGCGRVDGEQLILPENLPPSQGLWGHLDPGNQPRHLRCPLRGKEDPVPTQRRLPLLKKSLAPLTKVWPVLAVRQAPRT